MDKAYTQTNNWKMEASIGDRLTWPGRRISNASVKPPSSSALLSVSTRRSHHGQRRRLDPGATLAVGRGHKTVNLLTLTLMGLPRNGNSKGDLHHPTCWLSRDHEEEFLEFFAQQQEEFTITEPSGGGPHLT